MTPATFNWISFKRLVHPVCYGTDRTWEQEIEFEIRFYSTWSDVLSCMTSNLNLAGGSYNATIISLIPRLSKDDDQFICKMYKLSAIS